MMKILKSYQKKVLTTHGLVVEITYKLKILFKSKSATFN